MKVREATLFHALNGAIIILCISCAVALGAGIPAIVVGSRTLVAVEPLLRSLHIGYVEQGPWLQIGGKPYEKTVVVRNGADLVDAQEIAAFLHMKVSRRDGALVFSALDAWPGAPAEPPPEAVLDAARSQLLDLLNQHRAASGLHPLERDSIAQRAAQFQADDMARAAVMRHLDSQGRSPMQRYASFGGRAGWYGENVGWYGSDPGGASALWHAIAQLDGEMMAERPPEDGHREAILSPRYDAVGIGVSIGPSGTFLAEDFVGR